MEREAEAGGRLGDLDSYEIEGGDTKSEVLQNLTEFQFSCVGPLPLEARIFFSLIILRPNDINF